MIAKKIAAFKKKILRSLSLWINRLMFSEILVLGDSHANVFKQKTFKSLFPKYFFNVVDVGGATVSGLKNPNSKTQALPIFTSTLKQSKAAIIIVLLGEVDTGFVIWYRAEKYQSSVESMLDLAVQNYKNLLSELSKQARIICVSTPLPTIEDNNDWGGIANARKEIKTTQLQRTTLTIKFNKMMQVFCEQNNIDYLSLDRQSIGENGLVKSQLLNADPNDHHYNQKKYSELISDKLKSIIL